MAEQTEVTKRAVIGNRRKAEEMATLQDPWAEAPFFAPPSKTGKVSEHITTLDKGDVICAVFHGIRRSKNEVASKQRDYAVLTTEDGENIRLFTSAQLVGLLRDKNSGQYKVQPGTYVEITYMGREQVVGYDDPLHQFEVMVGKPTLN